MSAIQSIYDFARSTPEATALVHNLQATSYSQLHRQVTALRKKLQPLALRQGAVAVVWMDNIRAAWIATLALRSLGLTTLAVRHEAELAALGGLDAVAFATFGPEGRAAAVPGILPAARRIVVAADDWAVDEAPTEPLEPPPDCPAGDHILLTSGTTGRYKMVLIDEDADLRSRAAIVDVLLSNATWAGAGGKTNDPARAMINCVDMHLYTAGGYRIPSGFWSRGDAVILHQQPGFHRSLEIPGITHFLAIPATLAQALQAAPADLPRNDDLTVIVGAGALSAAMAAQIRARLTNRILTALGSTEGGAIAVTPIETDDDLRWHKVHPTRTVEVVDQEGCALGPGQLGELRILQTNGVAGYLNDPEASREAFRDGWFYPGDLAVLDQRGRVAMLGRVTDVLNVGGLKAPTAPLEEDLQRLLGVEGVCLLSEQAADGAEHVHVVIEGEAPAQSLLRTAAETLRPFTDIHFHFVANMPRNQTGKIERLKLRRQLMQPS